MTTTVNKYKLNSISDIISKFEIKNSNKRNPLNENRPSSAKYGLMLNENVVDLLSKNCDTSSQIHKTMIIDTGCPSANESAINFPIPSVTNQSKRKMTESKFSHLFELMSWLPLSLLSVTGMGVTCLIAAFALPRAISQLILYPGFRLLFGTLYPAYASYKAIRTKNVKEYVKWMMYWIVFAFFSCIETFTDIFLSWFPFYYEVKVIIVLWLLSPATKGSSTLYRKFVHPMLTKREQEIDEYINQAKEKGYSAVLQLGSKGVNYATSMIMQTAIKGGGNLVSTLRNSYSLTDLSDSHLRAHDEIDEAQPQRLMRSRTQSTRSSSIERNYDVYFSELNIASKLKEDAPDYRSIDDISSGYSSAEVVPGALSRTASLTNASKSRIRAKKAEDLTDNYRYVAADMNTDLATLLEDYPFLLNYLKVPEHNNQFSYSNFQISQQKDTDVFAKDNFKREELLDTRTEAFETNIIEPTIVKEDSCDDEFQDAENVVEEILSSTALIDNENHSDVPSPSDKLDTTSFPLSSLNVVDEVSIADSKLNTFTIPEIISDTVVGSILNDNSKVVTFKSESMEDIVDSQLSASKLDLTEAAYKRYSKRKAPLPPPINMIESQDETVITSQQLESIKKTDEKEKKKKHLLNYIPSIFRPISPANSSKSIHMETDI